MHARSRPLAALILTTLVSGATAPPASAQAGFPNRVVKIVNPLPSGSGPDVVIRLVAEKMTGVLGQQVIVENRPGGGGAIAAQAVAASPADGYTVLLAVASIFSVLPVQKDKLPIDVDRA